MPTVEINVARSVSEGGIPLWDTPPTQPPGGGIIIDFVDNIWVQVKHTYLEPAKLHIQLYSNETPDGYGLISNIQPNEWSQPFEVHTHRTAKRLEVWVETVSGETSPVIIYDVPLDHGDNIIWSSP